ncbi:hypothetical protein SO802_010164 [Lithocarpus litseifolius]|uniref:Glycosyltransferase n=1 Tax=Lithocarpus litseifolius TaxID=425828 RepID=A0AAW2DDJ2_9ROSI
MKKAELVFVSPPGMGHLVSILEIAKLLVARDDRLCITVLIMRLSVDSKLAAYIESFNDSSYTECIQFIDLPQTSLKQETNLMVFFSSFIESQKPHVKEAVTKLKESRSGSNSPRLAGFVVDMFCSSMVDVANDFGVPTYLFFPSSASFLSLMLHLQTLRDEQKQDITEFKDSDAELVLSSFVNPIPARVLPGVVLDREGGTLILDYARRWRETKGIIVNTFLELESSTIHSFSVATNTPPVYPVGPILNLKGEDSHVGLGDQRSDIMKWLDDQPQSSVVFLCFGSRGGFGDNQVNEIAKALERAGFPFLWSLRRPPPKGGGLAFSTEHENLEEVLPEGFLDRTARIGKIIGWAPQVAILSHPAIGGFVSHCGWNSILESLWFGVPIATWPLYAEQQFNAFEMVKEMELAAEIMLDYRTEYTDNQIIVTSEEIERGIKHLMENDSKIRKNVKEMTEKGRKALMDGGSSHFSLGRIIDDVITDSMP